MTSGPRSFARFLTPHFLTRPLLGLPTIVIFTAILVICWHSGTFWPWTKVVHEDGQRTLIETILFYQHATRELPLDVILGVAIGGSVSIAFPPDGADAPKQSFKPFVILLLLLAITVAATFVGTWVVGGPTMLLDELLQKHTRSGVPPEFGSHWRYHLLSRLVMIIGSVALAGMICLADGRQLSANSRAGLTIIISCIGAYMMLTIVFSSTWSGFMQPFRDPRYLGHQAREVLTHALVTVPLAWGLCLLMVSRQTGSATTKLSAGGAPIALIAGTILAGTLSILLSIYVGVGAFRGGAMLHGQTHDFVTLIFPHFFEHTFSYAIVPLVAAATYKITISLNKYRFRHSS